MASPPVAGPVREGNTPDHPVLDKLDQLRGVLRCKSESGQLDQALNTIQQSVSQCLVEHEGMVEELLRVYEQLGVVFDVTRKLPDVQDEGAVIRLFKQSLTGSFPGRDVAVFHPVEHGGWRGGVGASAPTPWQQEQLTRARQEGRVHVFSPPEGEDQAQSAEIMVGPVSAGEDFVCALTLSRPPSVVEFRASDMLLLESLAAFCGDLIRNHRLVRELRQASIAMVRSLVVAIEQKDEYTSGHSTRVGYFAVQLGRRDGLGGNRSSDARLERITPRYREDWHPRRRAQEARPTHHRRVRPHEGAPHAQPSRDPGHASTGGRAGWRALPP
jgi:hypothetical protein